VASLGPLWIGLQLEEKDLVKSISKWKAQGNSPWEFLENNTSSTSCLLVDWVDSTLVCDRNCLKFEMLACANHAVEGFVFGIVALVNRLLEYFDIPSILEVSMPGVTCGVSEKNLEKKE